MYLFSGFIEHNFIYSRIVFSLMLNQSVAPYVMIMCVRYNVFSYLVMLLGYRRTEYQIYGIGVDMGKLKRFRLI